MTTSAQPAATSFPAPDDLGVAALSHLQEEEKLLQTAVDVLKQTRSALVSGNLQSLELSLERQAALEHASNAMTHKRGQFRALAALPSQASSLDILADRLAGPARAMFQQTGTRLRRLAATAAELNRGNAVLLRSNLDLLDQVLSALTGGDGGGKRYGRAGEYQAGGYGSLVSARG